MPTIRELKRDYKIRLALGEALPLHDQAISLPLSTGNALFDSALTDKLVATRMMSEPEHVARAWQLVRSASKQEITALLPHGRGLLNDYKLLLALRCWEDGDDSNPRRFLGALPWGWRLAFPTAVIKPAAHLFTGWRTSLNFRLVEEPRFDALKVLYRDLLSQAPPVALMKYRAAVKQSTALLHYRFEGDRERAIHNWCFGNGEAVIDVPELEPLPTYVRARRAVREGGATAFLDVLNASQAVIPITSYMGLLGSSGLSLTDNENPHAPALRDYAIQCATAVECLLRIAQWSPWLKKRHAEALSTKVREAVDDGLNLPFFKVLKGFLAAPPEAKKLVLEPLLLPLMKDFGARTAGLLPPPGPLTFVQPGNVIHVMSYLLYACLSTATETRMHLMYRDGVEEIEPIPLERIGPHLADQPYELQQWLLEEFGGLSTQFDFTYNTRKLNKVIGKLDPQAPLVLDVPFYQDMDLLRTLMPFERVFNLNSALGAPGEICVATQYYSELYFATKGRSVGVWSRYADSAAVGFAELLERLRYFQTLSEEARKLKRVEA